MNPSSLIADPVSLIVESLILQSLILESLSPRIAESLNRITDSSIRRFKDSRYSDQRFRISDQ